MRALEINEEMKQAAVYAIAGLVSENELSSDYCIPHPFDPRIASRVEEAVARAAVETGVAQILMRPEETILTR